MITDYLFGVLGIAVSVGLFFIGYRQTVGARKERIAAANADLERILVRRIVLEKYLPTETDISRLLEGKARDYRVRSAEVLSEAQVLNTVYTRIMESDLIPAEQREEILNRLAPVLSESESAPVQEEELEEVASTERRLRASRAAIAMMAVLTSVVGGLVTIIPEIQTMGSRIRELLPMIAGTAGASLAVIALFYSMTRLRASQEETANKAKELSKYFAFEDQVRKTLEPFGGVQQTSAGDRGFDFIVERGGRKIVVEVKTWSRPIPAAILSTIVKRLKEAAARTGAADAIIVTSGSTPHAKAIADAEGVKVLTLRELRNYVAHLAA